MDELASEAWPAHERLAVFPAAVWAGPDAKWQVRGASTADLYVYANHRLLVRPNALGRRIEGQQVIEYAWPAVVVETLVWSRRLNLPRFPGVLVDVDGRLRRVAVSGGGNGRLSAALRASGFHVVEVTHVGSTFPTEVTPAELGEAQAQVPPSLFRSPFRL